MARRWQRKQNQQASTDSGGWQVVYTGFILIMLCFFIMLSSFASLQQAKIVQFVKAFSTAVSVLNGGLSLEKGETIFETKFMVIDKEDPMARLFNAVTMYSETLDINQVEMQLSEHGVIMTLADTLLFESGKADLSSDARALLHKISILIHKVNVPVEIEGHTDNVPIATPAFPSNWELSTARAVNVLRYLIEQQAVDASRLSAVGMSEYQPVASNDTAANRARNRRVAFVFKPQGKEAGGQ